MMERSNSPVNDWLTGSGSPTSMTISSKRVFRVRTKITNTPTHLKERIFRAGQSINIMTRN
jgi:hypothetical protein